jgi:peroxidase
VEFLDDMGGEVAEELPLANAFFNPAVVEETGIDPILKYLASDRAQEVDPRIVEGVRNFLFGPPGAGGFDLASLNIQRGRDHGLADYNTTRAAYGLPRVDEFSDITSNLQLQAALEDLYGSVDNIDLRVGGLSEDHVAGGSVGPLLRTIIADQFERLRDGDRFWYQAVFGGRNRDSVVQTRLSDVIRRNTELENLQTNVFFFDVTIQGAIYRDANSNARRDVRERGLAAWTVQLLDADGNVLEETLTSASGRYRFTGLDLGVYRVRVVAPQGQAQISPDQDDVVIPQGMTVSGVDFGYA